MKRIFAEHECRGSAPSFADDNGSGLREFLAHSYAVQQQVDASFLVELCWHITHSPAHTVADLALHPKQAASNGSRHVKLVLGKNYKDPDLYYVTAPVFDKRQSSRTRTQIPLHLPSAIFAQSYRNHVDPPIAKEPQESSNKFDCAAWQIFPICYCCR